MKVGWISLLFFPKKMVRLIERGKKFSNGSQKYCSFKEINESQKYDCWNKLQNPAIWSIRGEFIPHKSMWSSMPKNPLCKIYASIMTKFFHLHKSYLELRNLHSRFSLFHLFNLSTNDRQLWKLITFMSFIRDAVQIVLRLHIHCRSAKLLEKVNPLPPTPHKLYVIRSQKSNT